MFSNLGGYSRSGRLGPLVKLAEVQSPDPG